MPKNTTPSPAVHAVRRTPAGRLSLTVRGVTHEDLLVRVLVTSSGWPHHETPTTWGGLYDSLVHTSYRQGTKLVSLVEGDRLTYAGREFAMFTEGRLTFLLDEAAAYQPLPDEDDDPALSVSEIDADILDAATGHAVTAMGLYRERLTLTGGEALVRIGDLLRRDLLAPDAGSQSAGPEARYVATEKGRLAVQQFYKRA